MRTKKIKFHEVSIKFLVSEGEAMRVTGNYGDDATALRARFLSTMLKNGITGNTTNGLEVDELVIAIDGETR